MKKLIFALIIVIFASSCASQRCHGVGNTTHALKAKKQQQQRTFSQFPF
jgi:hypothetical protein